MLVCLFWSAVLWMDWRRQGSRAKLWLMLFSIAATLLYMGHYVYFNLDYAVIPVVDTIYSMANLAVFPLYYLYIREMTEGHSDRKCQIYAIIPAVAIGMAVGTIYALMSPEDKLCFIQKYLYAKQAIGGGNFFQAQSIVHNIAKIIFGLQVTLVLTKGYKRIKKFDEMVENSFADTDERTLRNSHTILLLLVITSVVSFIANVIGKDVFAGSLLLLSIPSVVFSSLLFMLLYIGHRQDFSIKELREETSKADTIDSVGAGANVISQLSADIERIMNEEMYFLQPDLRISDLAIRLHTNRQYIYQAININLHTTFSEYINRKRVEHVKQLLKENPEALSTEIYLKAGFTSQASYFRNFKLHTGMTPKQYLQKWTENLHSAKIITNF